MDTASHLYSSGAFIALGVFLVWKVLDWGSTHIAWLQAPGRAHYVTVAVAVAAVFGLPASQGTTPNMSMLFVAIGAAASLLAPGVKSTSSNSSSAPAGSS